MNTQFNDKEFSQMMFNPVKVVTGSSVFRTFPEFKKHKIFQKTPGPEIDNNMLMIYIICMYDKNTPYRAKYRDILKRKIEVAHDVGFVISDNGVFTTPVENFLRGLNPIVNEKIIEFVRMQRSFKYSYFVSIESSYYNLMAGVIGGNTKGIAELKKIQIELEDTMLEILNDDNNPHVRDMFLRYVETERLELRPEDIALKISKGERPITTEEVFG